MLELLEVCEADDEDRELQVSPMDEFFELLGCTGTMRLCTESKLFLRGAFG